uniref:EGF-like domain-containing protein n=1 Tax=Callorhinchus milii TaxID=7868 RepID=A0A4W3GXY3_CALMI
SHSPSLTLPLSLTPPLSLRCSCPEGFGGRVCDADVDDCEDHACGPGATCVDGVNNYTCVCPPHRTGAVCEELTGSCAQDSNPCQRGSRCELTPEGHR